MRLPDRRALLQSQCERQVPYNGDRHDLFCDLTITTMVAERFISERELDATLDYVFTLRMKPTPVKLRLLKSASADHMYLLVKR